MAGCTAARPDKKPTTRCASKRQYFDPESGLHYNRHRYYVPDIGRYLTPDPVKLAGGINTYQYAPNPTGCIDPLGLTCVSGRCPGQPDKALAKKHEQKAPETSDSIRSSTYEQAVNKALDWLLENNFRAEKPTPGRFGPRKGEPVGMQTADGKTGYRIEHDRSGAHINVRCAKKKGPHYIFDASPKTVFQPTKRFAKKMSYFDEKLTTELRFHGIQFTTLHPSDHTSIVREINEKIPFSGSKISWTKLKKSINFGHELQDLAFSRLSNEIQKVADDTIIILSDSVCDEAYCTNTEHLEKTLRIFSEIPQHTYITSKSLTWIACISFEGQLDFAKLLSE